MEKKFKHTLNIILGDFYGDGHREWDIVYFRCTEGVNYFNYCYKEGVKQLHVDPANWCSEYQQRECKAADINTLIEHGFSVDSEELWFSEDLCEISPNVLVDAILFVAEVGSNNSLKTKRIPNKMSNNAVLDKSGVGYGLF